MDKYINEARKLQDSNKKLTEELKSNEVKRIILSSIGNSISSGFSILNSNAPLLQRNETLKNTLLSSGIQLETHQYSRIHNNDDEYIYRLILENRLESEFNQITMHDYEAKAQIHEVANLDLDLIKTYYPPALENDRGVLDALKDNSSNTANIAIINAGTGAFVANWGYQGKHKLTGGIKKDRTYIETMLSLIQALNRNGSNTQVYLCGAPRVLNLSLAEIFINPALRNMVTRYANVVYVPAFYKSPFYPNDINPFFVDPHYDENEYLHLLNIINERIINNYQIKQYIIEIDRILSKKSKELEMSLEKKDTYDEIISIIETFSNKITESGKDINLFLQQLQTYLLERYPYDFAYLSRSAIVDSAKLLRKR